MGKFQNSLVKMKGATVKVGKTIGSTTLKATKTIKEKVNKTINQVKKFEEKLKREEELRKLNEFNKAFNVLKDTYAEDIVLRVNPAKRLEDKLKSNSLKRCFSIPVEQTILYVSTTKGRKPTGIALTEKAVYIKVGLNDGQHLETYPWELFDPEYHLHSSSSALRLLDETVVETFKDALFNKTNPVTNNRTIPTDGYEDNVLSASAANIGIGVATTVLSSETAEFSAKYSVANGSTTGHGFMAEEANNLWDKFLFKNAKVVGGDFEKDGADRLVNGVLIQSKYCSSATKSVNHAFDKTTGLYRYVDKTTGKPMQLEVPSDQWEKSVKVMEQRIVDKKVPGVTDPSEASNIVRKGRVTYAQAKNLAKAGTIESLVYDSAKGMVIGLSAFGISFIVTSALELLKTKDYKYALTKGLKTASVVFGASMVSQVLLSQIGRTTFFNEYVKSYVTVTGTLVGATVSAISFSIPEIWKLVTRKQTGTQFYVNVTSLLGGAILSAGLASAGAVIGARAGSAGGAIGAAIGGVVGGVAGSAGVSLVNGLFFEDDYTVYCRMLQSYIPILVSEYMLSEQEIDSLYKELSSINRSTLEKFFRELVASKKQEKVIRGFLEPYFLKTAKARPFIGYAYAK